MNGLMEALRPAQEHASTTALAGGAEHHRPAPGGGAELSVLMDRLADGDGLCQLWQQHLPGFAQGPGRILALESLQVRRSASRQRNPHPLTVHAALHVHGVPGLSARRLVVYGKVCRHGAPRLPLTAPAAQGWRDDPAGAWLPGLNMQVWAMPHDPGLPQLAALLDPQAVRAHLPEPWRDGQGAVRVLLRAHTPEVRAVLHVRGHSAGQRLDLYGKTYADAALAQAVHQRLRWAHDAANRHPEAPTVPEPMGLDRNSHTVWWRTAPGRSAEGASLAELHQIGQALARWQQLPMVTGLALPQVGVAQLLQGVGLRVRKVQRVAPPAPAHIASALLDWLHQEAAKLPEQAVGVLHGDFHAGQVLLPLQRRTRQPDALRPPAEACVMLDLDEMATGPGLLDATAFALRLPANPQATAAERAASFVRGFRTGGAQPWDARSWRWFAVLQGVQLAARAFVFHKPGWQQALAEHLTRAQALAAGDWKAA